jgi:hypothetical protein
VKSGRKKLETRNRKLETGLRLFADEINVGYGAVGQTTVAVIVPVTMAPLDDMLPML